MTRMTLRRAVTAVSFLTLMLGGAAVPAAAATDSSELTPGCWYTRCDGQL